jgi:membrane-associated PAP2 superfamily phosphatase
MNDFLSGAIMMGFAVAGLFFCRYYRRTRDRLFAIFAAAFFLMSLNRWMIAMSSTRDELWTLFYLVRLLAFVLILVAILDKNRAGSRGGQQVRS